MVFARSIEKPSGQLEMKDNLKLVRLNFSAIILNEVKISARG